MTDLLEEAVSAARSLPPDMQDDIARVVLMMASGDLEPVPLTVDERQAIARSKAAAARGDFATDGEVQAVLAKYGR